MNETRVDGAFAPKRRAPMTALDDAFVRAFVSASMVARALKSSTDDGAALPVRDRICSAGDIFTLVEFCAHFAVDGEASWRESLETALERLSQCMRLNGGAGHKLILDGGLADSRLDLENQADAILALAAAYDCLKNPAHLDRAKVLCIFVDTHFRDPTGGYADGAVTPDRLRRLRAHLKLLQAYLALAELDPLSDWRGRALRLAELTFARFYDPHSKRFRELALENWAPVTLAASSDDRSLDDLCAWTLLRVAEFPEVMAICDRTEPPPASNSGRFDEDAFRVVRALSARLGALATCARKWPTPGRLRAARSAAEALRTTPYTPPASAADGPVDVARRARLFLLRCRAAEASAALLTPLEPECER